MLHRNDKTTRDNLARSESATVGTLPADWPDSLPPAIARLIADAPDSFGDLRHGLTALAMRQVADAGEPVNIVSVERWLANKHADFAMPRGFLRERDPSCAN
jgi:hypothetical protein